MPSAALRRRISFSSSGCGIVQAMAEHEPVELGLGQLERPALLDRVLGGDHQERRRQLERLVADRDAALLHRFEQGALDLGRGPVDLVGQQQVGEDRPLVDAEVVGPLVEDLRADDVGGEQVDGELDAGESGGRSSWRGPRPASVLASPGTPWSSRWPPVNRAIRSRSTTTSWPTTTVPTRSRTVRMNSSVSAGIAPEPRSGTALRSMMLMTTHLDRKEDETLDLAHRGTRERPRSLTPVSSHHKGWRRGRCKPFPEFRRGMGRR